MEIPCKKDWLPTTVFSPGEFHGQKSLMGYSPWGPRVRHTWATDTFTWLNIFIYTHIHMCTHTHTYLTLMLILMLLLYLVIRWRSDQIRSVAQSCPTLCDPVNRNTPGLPVHHQLPEFTQTHVHWVSHAIQPSHPLSSPSPPAPNPSQHQSLFQWVNSSHEVAKVLRFQIVKLKEVSCLWSHLVASKF